ncbi:MAG: ATP-binding protein [Acidobacteriota bacterium]
MTPIEPRKPPCGPDELCFPVRELTITTLAFIVAVVVMFWALSDAILRDLSDSYVAGMIATAKEETEGFVRDLDPIPELGDGEPAAVYQGPGSANDLEAVSDDDLVDRLSEASKGRVPRSGRSAEIPIQQRPLVRRVAEPPNGRLRGSMSQTGREVHTLINGELIRRRAVRHVEVRYPGGRRRITLAEQDDRDFDPAALAGRPINAEQIHYTMPPHSRPVSVEWDSSLNGQPVQLSSVLDGAVLDEGRQEIYEAVRPKLVTGGAVFLLMMVLVYLQLLRLIKKAQAAEGRAAERNHLAEVGVMAAGLAHEIRNPLSSIRMNLQLLEEDLDPEPDSKQLTAAASPFGRVQGELRRLSRLVSDFLSYARPAEPRLALQPVDDLVDSCVELIRPTVAGREVELVTTIELSGREAVLDEAMVKQALSNIVLNALQALDDRPGRVEVTTRLLPNGFEIAVTDDGPGLPDDPESLFQVFHTTKPGGFGLGLPISRSLIERQGGRLVAERRSEGGACFRLVFEGAETT